MEQQFNEIRDQQKESWNKFSPGWRKWDDLIMDFLKPMGDEIIRLINPKNNETILDIAGGTGELGLTISAMLKGGKVVITDLSPGMLQVVVENAEKKGIKNIDIHACDACELPFDDNSFDSISCRLGFMFFPDMLMAIKEMARVLKPGGRIASAVWGNAEKNFWVTAIGGTINRNMQLITPPIEAPGIFRCAESGLIMSLYQQAGLINTSEKEVAGKMNCGTTDVYWNMMTDVAAPFVSALSNADEPMKEKIRKEVYQLVNQKYPNGIISFDSSALVIYGEKEAA